MRLVVATNNKGKLREIKYRLDKAGLSLDLLSLADFPNLMPVEEDGKTFFENASKKARETARQLNLPVLADDSGIEVDALDSAPGVYSARFSGTNSDLENNKLLLKKLENIPDEKRTARFKCVMVLIMESDKEFVSTGVWEGKIARFPRGDNGFGYDPLFVPNGHSKSAAELESTEKNRISHRGRALDGIIAYLKELAGN